MKRYITETYVDQMEMLTRPQSKPDAPQQPQQAVPQPESGDNGMPF